MSETVLLSSLCGICHTQPPKYTCPRCHVRTCSLPCAQKHKVRATCDGIRNPRAFMPIEKLRTPAGIDHDYNFLSSIERSRQRADEEIIQVRQLLSQNEVLPQDPKDDDKRFRKNWYGDQVQHVPVSSAFGRNLGDTGISIGASDVRIRRRLQQLDIEAVAMPKGMTRQKENRTSWNKRVNCINWQVEWVVIGSTGLGIGAQEPQRPVRILRKILEETPLSEAFSTTLEWHRGQLDRQRREQEINDDSDDSDEALLVKRKVHRRKRKPVSATQEPESTTWPAAPYTIQPWLNGEWCQTSTSASAPKLPEEDAPIFAGWQFFLLKPSIRGSQKGLIPTSPTDTLAATLSGRTVVEFPTLYVLPPQGQELPAGFPLEDTARRKRKIEEVEEVEEGEAGEKPEHLTKKQAFERHQGNSRGRGGGRGGRGGRGAWGSGGARGERGGRGGRGRRGGGGGKNVTFERPDESSVDEGEVNSDGYDVSVEATRDVVALIGESAMKDLKHQQTVIAKKGLRGLVDYGSDESE